jgi:hypothetical protein
MDAKELVGIKKKNKKARKERKENTNSMFP